MKNRQMAAELAKIIEDTSMDEMDRLTAAYGHVTAKFIAEGQNRIELARAMGDQEEAVKEQIMIGVMQTAREMFEYCYILVSGSRRSLWDD